MAITQTLARRMAVHIGARGALRADPNLVRAWDYAHGEPSPILWRLNVRPGWLARSVDGAETWHLVPPGSPLTPRVVVALLVPRS
jgi:hypothetical protein